MVKNIIIISLTIASFIIGCAKPSSVIVWPETQADIQKRLLTQQQLELTQQQLEYSKRLNEESKYKSVISH